LSYPADSFFGASLFYWTWPTKVTTTLPPYL
jgi:hypothetical protein